jgi:acetylornithine/succinyldiaminopimelate/putrescine aminotransferase
VLDTIERDGLLANVAAMGELLRAEVARLAPAGTLVEVRGRGLLNGFQVAPGIAAHDVVMAMLRRGALASTAGPDTVRFTPPYTITAAEVDEAVKALSDALGEVAS